MLAVWLRTGGQERERCGLVRTFGTLWVGWERIEPYGSSGKLWNSVGRVGNLGNHMGRVGTYGTLWIEWEPMKPCGLGGNLWNSVRTWEGTNDNTTPCFQHGGGMEVILV